MNIQLCYLTIIGNQFQKFTWENISNLISKIFMPMSKSEWWCSKNNSLHKLLLCIVLGLELPEDRWINSSPPGQNGHHFADYIFTCIIMNGKFCILIKISLKFVPKGPIHNNLALVFTMAWWWIRDKSLSEPMLTRFTDAYICSTRGR